MILGMIFGNQTVLKLLCCNLSCKYGIFWSNLIFRFIFRFPYAGPVFKPHLHGASPPDSRAGNAGQTDLRNSGGFRPPDRAGSSQAMKIADQMKGGGVLNPPGVDIDAVGIKEQWR
jgi:hypothetical protein